MEAVESGIQVVKMNETDIQRSPIVNEILRIYNIPKINYPSIYPYQNETTVTDKQIYNDIFALNAFLRHPHFYYMSRVTDGMPSKIEHHEYK